MQKILLVAANGEQVPDPVPPIGAAYVAAAARSRGHVTKILDTCFSEDYETDLASALATFRPEVVGLSIRNVDNLAYPNVTCYLDRYENMARICREGAPQAALFVGGSAFSLFADELIRKLDVDYGVVGEGERVFVTMVDEIERHGRVVGDYAHPVTVDGGQRGIVLAPRVDDLDTLSTPALDLLDVERYFSEGGAINVQTKRGCVYRCVYCTYPILEGHNVRLRDPALVVDEIESCWDRYGVDYYFLVDNVFNHPAEHAEAFCREILRRGLKIRWTAYVTPARATRDLFAVMRESGCQSMDVGTDCVSNSQLKRLGKTFDVEQILRVSEWCHELGIRFNHSLVFGGPGETWATVHETVDNAVRSKANGVIAVVGVRLYPNTPLADYVVSRGLAKREQISITPVFFISEEIREGILGYLEQVATQYRNWIIPGLRKNMNERFFKRMRARDIKGPLWELLDPIEYQSIPPKPPDGQSGGKSGDRRGVFRGTDSDAEQYVAEIME